MTVKKKEDPCMKKIKKLYLESEWTLREFGLKLGYPEEGSKQAVFQFFKTANPTIRMLRRIAKVFHVTVEDLL